ncbi:hypothetical protein HYS03_01195 [Candidatus Woesebacteria bacterium]|nr:hypothetical protein [Candidatus Woesebacteria bacterium]QQG47773.1 MAG: hypothetical protein HY044_01645 [Candidatus Woesebacteria bacterium]
MLNTTLLWVVVFVILSVLSLLWATSKLSGKKVYSNKDEDYPHNLEFNSSFAVLFSIGVTIFTSVILGYFIARFIQPGDNGTPNIGVTVLFVAIWLIALVIDIFFFMEAKVVHVWWPKDTDDKIYPVGIAMSIAFSTLFTISLLTITSSVVAFLIAQNAATAF